MTSVVYLAYRLLDLYALVLFGRFVLDYIRMASRNWRPTGPFLVVAEVLYTLTDPVLRALRRVLPPLRIGGLALDLSYLAAYLGIAIARNLLGSLL